jgi:hypothetical protein
MAAPPAQIAPSSPYLLGGRAAGVQGDEVIVTYKMTRRDGGKGRNTEILTYDGDRITGAEVYFGWNL